MKVSVTFDRLSQESQANVSRRLNGIRSFTKVDTRQPSGSAIEILAQAAKTLGGKDSASASEVANNWTIGCVLSEAFEEAFEEAVPTRPGKFQSNGHIGIESCEGTSNGYLKVRNCKYYVLEDSRWGVQSWSRDTILGCLGSLLESHQVEVDAISIKTFIVFAHQHDLFQGLQFRTATAGFSLHSTFDFDKLSTIDVSEHDSTAWPDSSRVCLLSRKNWMKPLKTNSIVQRSRTYM